ncbi:MAG: hypothetical protein JWN13_4687 [Betaproteobacteria bacterium]|jgi:hypothetical protein|nr:hypothetical protein [Betaproteobacteria bacterium]
MWNDRTLEADIEYAAEMVREGLATAEQAAHACGIPLARLQAHLTHAITEEPTSEASHALKGSVASSDQHQSDDEHSHGVPAKEQTADTAGPPVSVETTDYFVFFREDNRWVWKRVDRDGNIVKTCENGFPLYLDCVGDARPHGFAGRPLFIFAASDIAALNAPDKPS